MEKQGTLESITPGPTPSPTARKLDFDWELWLISLFSLIECCLQASECWWSWDWGECPKDEPTPGGLLSERAAVSSSAEKSEKSRTKRQRELSDGQKAAIAEMQKPSDMESGVAWLSCQVVDKTMDSNGVLFLVLLFH